MAKQQQGEMVLMEEVLKTVRAIGAKKTIEVLVELRNVSSSPVVKQKQEIIINEVLVEFNMSIGRLMGVKHDTRYPRMFCYVLLKKHLSFEANQIAQIFSRSANTVYCEMAQFAKLNVRHPYEANLLNRFKALDEIILSRINK